MYSSLEWKQVFDYHLNVSHIFIQHLKWDGREHWICKFQTFCNFMPVVQDSEKSFIFLTFEKHSGLHLSRCRYLCKMFRLILGMKRKLHIFWKRKENILAERRWCPDLRVEERRAAKVGGGKWGGLRGEFQSVPLCTSVHAGEVGDETSKGSNA